MKRVMAPLMIAACMLLPSAGAAWATDPHGPANPTGRPMQSCGSATAPNTPGKAASARGSAFNPDGIAGMHYAGQQPQNSKNPKSVAQYDVACFQVSQH